MAILSVQIGSAGTSNTVPQIVNINTNDTVAAVTATGYLNNAVAEGFVFQNGSIAAVTTQTSPSSTVISSGWYSIQISGANTSLVASTQPGDVTLPTIANHIATFTNTTGTISEDPATAISGGNIQAGLSSGTAGSVVSMPGTANKGSLKLTAVANTGNTATVVSNDAMGQASTVNIPDPGNAVGQFLVGATATPLVSGNFPKNSGTAGLVVDSGIAVTALAQTANVVVLAPSAHTQSVTGNILLNSNPLVVANVVTATHTALATAGKVNIFVAPTGTAQIAILDIKVFYSASGLSGGSGNRLLALTDGTLNFNTTGITAALLGTPIFTLWGGTGNPIPSSTEATVSTAGANVYLQYIGGTTDYSAGQVTVAVTYAQVTT